MHVNFDTDNVMVAVPVMGATLAESRSQWAAAVQAGADLVEWRLDYLEEGVGQAEMAALAADMRARHGRPVLATYRTRRDGGSADFVSTVAYRQAVESVATWADLLDVEVSDPGAAQIIRDLAPIVPIVASFHDFTSSPSSGITKQLLEHMADLGASVAKVAWMVKDARDLEQVQAMQRWAAHSVGVPCVVIGMGALGTESRLGESARLSAFTFARGVGPGNGESAPGQPTVQEIRVSVLGERFG